MGTHKTIKEKMDYVRKLLKTGQGFNRKFLVSNLMINFNCIKKSAEEIVQAFLDSNTAEEKTENGEIMIYG